MEVISLDEGRIVFNEKEVIKLTSESEKTCLVKASETLKTFSPFSFQGKEYNICTPNVYDFSNGKLTMERCFGDNLEILLRGSKHDVNALLVNELLKYFIENKFFWKDFAPRNIMINDNYIYIMDFERGLVLGSININDYFANNVYEEYSAFLLPDERQISIDEALPLNINCKNIIVENIKSKRIKMILRQLGYTTSCSLKDYYEAVRMLINAETPFVSKGEIIFPLVELEDYIKEKGYEKYAKRIIKEYGKIEVYNPFNMDSEFHIITDNNKRYFKIENLLLEISENGYIPKSGLLFYDVLNEKNIANKSILDLGCGFLGILGIISMLRGAKTIEAVDYDLNCVYWFNKLIKDNNFNIDCYQSDYLKMLIIKNMILFYQTHHKCL